MMVIIEGDLADAVCAEPVIRVLGEKIQGRGRVDVCLEHADLYTGHPSIGGVVYDELEIADGQYDKTLRLKPSTGAVSFHDRTAALAAQIGQSISSELPRVHLSSFDLLRTQRFGVAGIKTPRIAIAVESPLSDDQLESWNRMCKVLEEKLQCGFVVLGDQRIEWGVGKNLTGRLMAREMVATMNQCSLLITSQKTFAALGLAAGIPVTLLDEKGEWTNRKDYNGILPVEALNADTILTAITDIQSKQT